MAENLFETETYSMITLSVRDVNDVCRRVTGQPIRYKVKPRRAGDPAILIGDVRKVANFRDWQSERKWPNEIIGSVWNWLRAQAALNRTRCPCKS